MNSKEATIYRYYVILGINNLRIHSLNQSIWALFWAFIFGSRKLSTWEGLFASDMLTFQVAFPHSSWKSSPWENRWDRKVIAPLQPESLSWRQKRSQLREKTSAPLADPRLLISFTQTGVSFNCLQLSPKQDSFQLKNSQYFLIAEQIV